MHYQNSAVISNASDINGNPHDECHECVPYASRCASTNDKASVYIPLALNCDNLLDLPVGVHWHVTVGFQDVVLEQIDQVCLQLFVQRP